MRLGEDLRRIHYVRSSDQEEAADVLDENEEGSEYDIEVEKENISSDSLAEASSPSSNKGRNKRSPDERLCNRRRSF